MVSLRQLRYLESLAETRHFGHAAEACAVSQPALSMQIKELEDELQLSLVQRRTTEDRYRAYRAGRRDCAPRTDYPRLGARSRRLRQAARRRAVGCAEIR